MGKRRGDALEPPPYAPVWTEYRYRLTRDLTADHPELIPVPLAWCMLNPSTATEEVDDATIRRIKSFTMAAGYSKLVVVNVFALRSRNPTDLTAHADPVGPRNVEALTEAFAESARVVFAWGSWKIGRLAHPDVKQLALDAGHQPMCLGVNKDGQPRHPLYLPRTAWFETWTGEMP